MVQQFLGRRLLLEMNTVTFISLLLIGLAMAAPLSEQEEWANFKTQFNKTYESPEEESRRFQIFQDNLNKIREHNEKFAKGEVSYTEGVNKFADLTHEEFRSYYTGYRGKPA